MWQHCGLHKMTIRAIQYPACFDFSQVKMSSAQNCLIEKLVEKISISRSSMELQIASMNEVLDKSNKALLQIEASRNKSIAVEPGTAQHAFNKETANALAKVVDKCIHMLNIRDLALPSDTGTTSLEDYMELTGQRAEYLGCNIRKLLAVWDIVQQMRITLQRQELSDDEEKENLY